VFIKPRKAADPVTPARTLNAAVPRRYPSGVNHLTHALASSALDEPTRWRSGTFTDALPARRFLLRESGEVKQSCGSSARIGLDDGGRRRRAPLEGSAELAFRGLPLRRHLKLLELPVRRLVRPHPERLLRERRAIRPIDHSPALGLPELDEAAKHSKR
jgi:hypothetical protein